MRGLPFLEFLSSFPWFSRFFLVSVNVEVGLSSFVFSTRKAELDPLNCGWERTPYMKKALKIVKFLSLIFTFQWKSFCFFLSVFFVPHVWQVRGYWSLLPLFYKFSFFILHRNANAVVRRYSFFSLNSLNQSTTVFRYNVFRLPSSQLRSRVKESFFKIHLYYI